ncbi:hypothetical protein [Rhizobium ruizarguesonis]|uniref:hypothetical protein n=1 Tax=Rhizobium ruizarguesonis TaxID=2081791 RepID=UPI0013EF46C6|nr:hypothetical protein [Rhizobium ruizarguesonis]
MRQPQVCLEPVRNVDDRHPYIARLSWLDDAPGSNRMACQEPNGVSQGFLFDTVTLLDRENDDIPSAEVNRGIASTIVHRSS